MYKIIQESWGDSNPGNSFLTTGASLPRPKGLAPWVVVECFSLDACPQPRYPGGRAAEGVVRNPLRSDESDTRSHAVVGPRAGVSCGR
ncbi:hypothetical protein E2C01_028191 [Portunus trituberculatus]|uniref:Uncharacterized protein n=1 Tax=Portunus trituberculatus TaxID=210409 RepID=A0A5B7EJU6_PORTR|nr:hypothetical protein [Portunus trituberculatus]